MMEILIRTCPDCGGTLTYEFGVIECDICIYYEIVEE